MIRTLRLPLLLAIALLGAAMLVACGGDDDDSGGGTGAGTGGGTAAATETAAASDDHEEGAIGVTLTEWALEVDEVHPHGGEVTFDISNKGSVPHDFAVIRTDLAADALPTASGAVDEDKVEVVGRTELINGGASASVSFDLAAGSYVLVCNVPAHYDLGMRVAFTVE